MSQCKLDHSREDVIKKLEEQSTFLPQDLCAALQTYLQNEREQQTLNEMFHLLKKYDLSSAEEREQRNQKLQSIVTKNCRASCNQ